MWGEAGTFIIQLDTCPATQREREESREAPQIRIPKTEMMLIRLDWRGNKARLTGSSHSEHNTKAMHSEEMEGERGRFA